MYHESASICNWSQFPLSLKVKLQAWRTFMCLTLKECFLFIVSKKKSILNLTSYNTDLPLENKIFAFKPWYGIHKTVTMVFNVLWLRYVVLRVERGVFEAKLLAITTSSNGFCRQWFFHIMLICKKGLIVIRDFWWEYYLDLFNTKKNHSKKSKERAKHMNNLFISEGVNFFVKMQCWQLVGHLYLNAKCSRERQQLSLLLVRPPDLYI